MDFSAFSPVFRFILPPAPGQIFLCFFCFPVEIPVIFFVTLLLPPGNLCLSPGLPAQNRPVDVSCFCIPICSIITARAGGPSKAGQSLQGAHTRRGPPAAPLLGAAGAGGAQKQAYKILLALAGDFRGFVHAGVAVGAVDHHPLKKSYPYCQSGNQPGSGSRAPVLCRRQPPAAR